MEIAIFINYAKSLRFEDKPDYLYLRKMFKELFYRESYEWDNLMDWCLPINVYLKIYYLINDYYQSTLKNQRIKSNLVILMEEYKSMLILYSKLKIQISINLKLS